MSFQAIQSSILEKARREAANLVKQASDERNRRLMAARQEAKRVASQMQEEARAEAELRYEEKLGAIRTDLRRKMLIGREEFIEQAWAQAMEKLRSYVRTKEYKLRLKELIINTAKLLDGDEFMVDANPRDLDAIARLKDEIEEVLAKEGFPKRLVVGKGMDCMGGAELADSKRRVVLDRTYEAKIRKLRPLLRSRLAQLLTGGVG